MSMVRYKQNGQACGASRFVTIDERGRVVVFHVMSLDDLATHVKRIGWFTMRRLIVVPAPVAQDLPTLLAEARKTELSCRRDRFDPALFTGEWGLRYYGDPVEASPGWIDIAIVFPRGGLVTFTVETYEHIAEGFAGATAASDEGYCPDLLVVERIDPVLIHESVSSIVAMGLLRCGIWTRAVDVEWGTSSPSKND